MPNPSVWESFLDDVYPGKPEKIEALRAFLADNLPAKAAFDQPWPLSLDCIYDLFAVRCPDCGARVPPLPLDDDALKKSFVFNGIMGFLMPGECSQCGRVLLFRRKSVIEADCLGGSISAPGSSPAVPRRTLFRRVCFSVVRCLSLFFRPFRRLLRRRLF